MDERKAAAMREVFRRHLPRHRRHPAEVTSDRLAEAREKWLEHFTGTELDMIGHLRDRLEEIAAGETD